MGISISEIKVEPPGVFGCCSPDGKPKDNRRMEEETQIGSVNMEPSQPRCAHPDQPSDGVSKLTEWASQLYQHVSNMSNG